MGPLRRTTEAVIASGSGACGSGRPVRACSARSAARSTPCSALAARDATGAGQRARRGQIVHVTRDFESDVEAGLRLLDPPAEVTRRVRAVVAEVLGAE